ncbi:DUF4145 domain-containing protein [uncultured Clostridium sp.]|uniref:DUF4145 domain-containing protein n=1 Tax=uncultured Clostridium sp. TaxID=59620 RepID=UPI0025D40C96|nr:DUF4145 domain-containing protein [uncultured Clostridium sp.]MDU4884322.1 DUF4145 domain-containing protein [Clostridium celatum]MDU7077478.1 DUF4145 domain-containing protein [Clostridium celatum]
MFKEPKYKESAFTCPWCGAYAQQSWSENFVIEDEECKCNLISIEEYSNLSVWEKQETRVISNLHISLCRVCKKYHVWEGSKLIYPIISNIPMPLEEMPQAVKELYLEARDVYPISHKSACALLRLAVQHLCKELGEKGKNINDDIGSLVSKGLPQKIQKALDIVRVVGNNAVHPGFMSEEDTKEYAQKMFKLLNIIVDDRIVQPREIDDLFKGLPEGPKKAIEKRDNRELVNSK